MSTTIRTEISKANPYHVEKERMLELIHFCRQYSDWVESYRSLECSSFTTYYISKHTDANGQFSDPTASLAIKKAALRTKINLIRTIAHDVDPLLERYIILAVTGGYSYNYLHTVMEMPIGKDGFYVRYRKFFWLLDQKKE